MASFGSSEISNMISSKRYRIKRGDNLSTLAEKFQNSFPSAKCMNTSSLRDKIYNMNRSAFGGSKDIIFEGKDLELKFMCDCRCHLKLDKSKKEYVFNDEDRLIFAIKGSSFWDDYCKCDREIGEYMKQTFRNMSGSSLPKSMPLPMKPSSSSSSSSRKIMEEIKRNLSGNMVTTNQIAEQFYKLMGASVSPSQINDLAVKLERENNTCRHNGNCPCSAPRDKVEQLSAKCLNDCYCCVPLNSTEKSNLKTDFYKVTKLDCCIGSVKELKKRMVK